MMLPTHAMVGLALATPVSLLAPEVAPAALTGSLAGSVAPDLDLYAGHRRTLHYPTLYALVAFPALVVALLVPVGVSVAVAAFLVAATTHCRMDRYGGGLELRPWEATSERAVYDHVRARWRRPKRWIRYDGSPGDLAALSTLGIPLWVVLDGPFQLVAGLALAVGGVYALLRRRLASLAPTVVGYAPSRLRRYVPDRYRP